LWAFHFFCPPSGEDANEGDHGHAARHRSHYARKAVLFADRNLSYFGERTVAENAGGKEALIAELNKIFKFSSNPGVYSILLCETLGDL
jgi:hypothetical protein